MEPRRSRWADTDSESDGDENIPKENIITTFKDTEEPKQSQQLKKKKKKKRVKEPIEEEKHDPNLTTKLAPQVCKAQEEKTVRSDGTTASKKEIKKKELDDLDAMLKEFGLESAPQTENNTEQTNTSQQKQQKTLPKTSNKEAFQAVRSEISARVEKSKKSKKKDKVRFT